MEIRKLSDKMSVSPQINPGDLPEIAKAGFKLVINNRPDGEAPGQPTTAEIAAAAEQAGLAYAYIPVSGMAMTEDAIAAHRAAIDQAGGPVFAYCRTGTRSTMMWALAESGRIPVDDLVAAAGKAGYDLGSMAPALKARLGG